jgi:hypothetical protein
VGHTNRPYVDIEEFNLEEGTRVAVKASNGDILYGVITAYERDRVTGEVRMTVG